MIRPGKIIKQVLMTFAKKPATVCYPFVKTDMPKKFRGRLIFHADKCVGCGMCVKDCPSNAITITKVGDKMFHAEIDLGKCIYCAQCVDSCFKKALEITSKFELASLDRETLKIDIDAVKYYPTQDKTK
jgi:formate hydrogenlyase subunit 6/NADH:ubiquinone oxidoreductase subunit I